MLDIELCKNGDYDGDLFLTDDGDIRLWNSVLQNARIAILWIASEWRLGPDIGLPWYEEILVRNPNTELVCQLIRDVLLDIEGVDDADVELTEFDRRSRVVKVKFTITVNGETYSEEVAFIYG